MSSQLREVVEGRQYQGEDESIAYALTTTNWGGTPTSPSVAVFDVRNGNYHDVTSVVMPTNSPSINGDVITLSHLANLTAGRVYRVEVQFTSGGNDLEAYFEVEGVR